MSLMFSYRNGYICTPSRLPFQTCYLPKSSPKHRKWLASLRTVFLLAKQLSLHSGRADLTTELCKAPGPETEQDIIAAFLCLPTFISLKDTVLFSDQLTDHQCCEVRPPQPVRAIPTVLLRLRVGGGRRTDFLTPVVVRSYLSQAICHLSGSQMMKGIRAPS